MSRYSSHILYLLITILVVLLYVNDFGPMTDLQNSINDYLARTLSPDGTRSNIVVVEIDKEAEQAFGEWPWDHDMAADLLAAIGGGEPKAILADFDFNEDARQDSAGNTDILAGQLGWIENITIPFDIALATFRGKKTNNPEHLFANSIRVDNPLGVMDEESSLLVRKVFLPAQKVMDADPHLGFRYTAPDPDRVLRRQPLVMDFEGYYYSASQLVCAASALGVTSDQITVFEGSHIQLGKKRTLPIDNRGQFFVSFSEEKAFRTYSVAQLLAEGFDLSKLKGKTVVVGPSASLSGVEYQTPTEDELSELYVNASIIDNIVNDSFLVEAKGVSSIIMLILFGIGGLCAYLLSIVKLWPRIAIVVGFFVTLAVANYFAVVSYGSLPPTAYFALQLILFLLAVPLHESHLLKASAAISSGKSNPSFGKPQAEPLFKTELAQASVRELFDLQGNQDNAPTSALTENLSDSAGDHQTIAADVSIRDSDDSSAPEPESDYSALSLSAEPSDGSDVCKPEIISPEPSGVQDSGSADTTINDSGEVGIPSEVEPIVGGPTNLGRYKITGLLGKGAMGYVYKGLDPAINRPVALKTIRLDFVTDPEELAELKERLHLEAQAAGKLSHPNIVTIYDVGSESQLQYIAMECLEGRTLEDIFRKKVKFNFKIMAQIITQICSALEYAHQHNIVHRDIKPANLMILDNYKVKVMDYGIARVDSNSMTKTGIAMGTPNYISPEQLKGGAVDHRADLFSLGVVIYEMLVGRRPFKGENLTSLIYAIANDNPEKPSNINPDIPLLFDHIVDKALKKNPAERYQRASDLRSDLADFVESFTIG